MKTGILKQMFAFALVAANLALPTTSFANPTELPPGYRLAKMKFSLYKNVTQRTGNGLAVVKEMICSETVPVPVEISSGDNFLAKQAAARLGKKHELGLNDYRIRCYSELNGLTQSFIIDAYGFENKWNSDSGYLKKDERSFKIYVSNGYASATRTAEEMKMPIRSLSFSANLILSDRSATKARTVQAIPPALDQSGKIWLTGAELDVEFID